MKQRNFLPRTPTSCFRKKAAGVQGLWLMALVVMMIFTVPNVYAGTVELPKTGQTTCYTQAGATCTCGDVGCPPGQDGELQMGVDWDPATRFTFNPDNTVSDTLTGLMWPQDGGTPTAVGCGGGWKSWDTGHTYINCLNTNNYLSHNDWRFPNFRELESLVNFGQSNTVTWLNSVATPFTNVQSTYWVSNHYLDESLDSHGAWVVELTRGDSDYRWAYVYAVPNCGKDCTSNIYVWPVRCVNDADNVKDGVCTTGAVELPKTGETVCNYKSGGTWYRDPECDDITYAGTRWELQDGWLRMGAAWPTTGTSSNGRFSDMLNETIIDHLTGLMWTKSGNVVGGTTDTWQGALDYIAGMNSGANPNYDYTDWRLPNRVEIFSLLIYGGGSTGFLRNKGFKNVVACSSYWTSTTDLSNTAQAYKVQTRDNFLKRWNKTATGSSDCNWADPTIPYYLWPVRDAGEYPFYLTVEVSPPGSGNTTGTGIVCPPDCQEKYTDPSPNPPPDVTLTATAYLGSSFDSWTGCDNPVGNVCDLTMDGNRGVTANFKVPDIAVDPTTVPFGNVNVGLTQRRTITLSNYDFVVFPIDPITPPSSPFSIVTDNCSGTSLTALTEYTGEQKVTGNNVQTVFNFTLDNSPVVERSATIRYKPRDESWQTVKDFNGTYYKDDPVLGVTGTIDYTTGAVSLTFNTAIQDSQWITANYNQGPLDSCDIIVEFAPTSTGSFNSTLDIPNLKTAALNGTGVSAGGPDISVSPNNLSFLNSEIKILSAYQTITVTNDGNGDLDIGQITIAGPDSDKFELANDLCSNSTLNGIPNCTVDVRLKAQTDAGGPYDATFNIPSNDPDESPLYVGLIGSAIDSAANPNLPTDPALTYPANGANVPRFKIEWDDATDVDTPGTVSNTLYYGTDPGFANATILGAVDLNNNGVDNDSGVMYAMVFGNPVMLTALFGIIAIGVFMKRKKITFLIVTVIFVGGLLLSSCGGGGAGGGAGVAEVQAGVTYYWKIVADDGDGGVNESPVYSFTVSP